MAVSLGTSLQELWDAARALATGRSNARGTFTCATSSATTTVNDTAIQVGDVLICTPTSANGGTEFGSGNFYITPATSSGTITVNHTNSATADRDFAYVVSE